RQPRRRTLHINGAITIMIGLALAFSDRVQRIDHGYHVILEGIMHTARYRSMLTELRDAHRGRTLFVYLDVSLPETLRRHETRPMAAEVSPDNLRSWYTPHDVLGWPNELVLPETTTLEQAIERIAAAAGLSLTGRNDDLLPAVP
ncbi:hypothetical protein, partial [Micromonospora sp. NPDC005324]|uniref:hypothetical protein n=1 Tax=Micromonospora sp. NPDC005324 TaxID=3157033 RepID=UPI0033BCC1D5